MVPRHQYLNHFSCDVASFHDEICNLDLHHLGHRRLPSSTDEVFQGLSLAVAGHPTSNASLSVPQVIGDMIVFEHANQHANRR